MPKFIDLTGKKFGKLLVEGLHGKVNRRYVWNCICDCGNKTIVTGGHLKDGHTESCGCSKAKHGYSGTNIYFTWQTMLQRCNNPKNPKYNDYGGRGIKICSEWCDFETFLKDMGERPKGKTLDRIDVNGNYEPSNCKWSTHKEQQNNMRSNIIIEFKGKTQTLTQWANELGLEFKTLQGRLFNLKWSVKKALTTPLYEFELFEFNGEKHTIADWSSITQIHQNTLNARIKDLKWPIEKALTKRPKYKGTLH